MLPDTILRLPAVKATTGLSRPIPAGWRWRHPASTTEAFIDLQGHDRAEAAGLGIRSADQIGGRHLKAFVAARLRDRISARTLANQDESSSGCVGTRRKVPAGTQSEIQQSRHGHRTRGRCPTELE